MTRSWAALLPSEFGEHPVAVGGVIALRANTLCASEPDGGSTAIRICIDRDGLVDHAFGQHALVLADRLNAQDIHGRRVRGTLGGSRIGRNEPGC